MNTSFVKSAPPGDFAEISILVAGWEARLQALAKQQRLIKYDMYPQPAIPPAIKNQLGQQGYDDLIVENDRWQHFLVPNSTASRT